MTALLALLLLGVVRAVEEVTVEVVTHRMAPRAVLVGLQKVHTLSVPSRNEQQLCKCSPTSLVWQGPFAWVKAREESGKMSLTLAPPQQRRRSRQQFLGDSDKPLLK